MILSISPLAAAITLTPDGYHVYPGDEIQAALEQAAVNPTNKVVRVHAGEYRPRNKQQAFIWFNRRHDGIQLLGEGAVTLTAANPELALPSEPGYPAVVNHVVYFGDGISSNTLLAGFRITGANGFVTKDETARFEPNRTIPRNYFFYSDGGGIKVFGRSYPRIRDSQIVDNFTRPCGAGLSVQHQGYQQEVVSIENCVFLRNRAQGTGAAIDLLAGSAARIVNCLFVENVSNTGEDMVAKNSGERPFVNNGVVTVFWKSRVIMERCTLTGNRNGVDDMGGESRFSNCIFFNNKLDTGLKAGARYELAVNAGGTVTGCFINGTVHDAQRRVALGDNNLNPPPPGFDQKMIPTAAAYATAGYRPTHE
ncbi:MAG: right-handed parallel beta-helix repeat-containing protein [Verrucomicrobiota bacterium]